MIFQKTIRNEISEEGVGLHSGEKVKLTLKPGAEAVSYTHLRAHET